MEDRSHEHVKTSGVTLFVAGRLSGRTPEQPPQPEETGGDDRHGQRADLEVAAGSAAPSLPEAEELPLPEGDLEPPSPGASCASTSLSVPSMPSRILVPSTE